MSCETGERWLTAYLDGSIPATDRAGFAAHLQACEECRDCVALWGQLGELPEPQSALRIVSMPARRSWPMLAAAAAVLTAVSAGGGWWIGRQTAAPPPRDEVAALRSEVAGLRSLVAVSMLGQDSAGARLQGISYAARLGTPESPEVLEALVGALQHDENVNVRLAACDALRRQTANPAVRRVLAGALATEDSPLVKVSLIEALADASARESVRPLLNLKSAVNEDEAVRTEAARALDRLKSKGISWE